MWYYNEGEQASWNTAFINLDTSRCWPAGLPSIYAIAEIEDLIVFMVLNSFSFSFLNSFRRNSNSIFTGGWNGLIFLLTQNSNHLWICGLYCYFVSSPQDPSKKSATSGETPLLSKDFLIVPSPIVSTLSIEDACEMDLVGEKCSSVGVKLDYPLIVAVSLETNFTRPVLVRAEELIEVLHCPLVIFPVFFRWCSKVERHNLVPKTRIKRSHLCDMHQDLVSKTQLF